MMASRRKILISTQLVARGIGVGERAPLVRAKNDFIGLAHLFYLAARLQGLVREPLREGEEIRHRDAIEGVLLGADEP